MMGRTLLALAVAAILPSCSPRPSVHQSFAQCKAEAAKAKAANPGIDADDVSDCMERQGYEIGAGECSIIAAPEAREDCYQPKR
ncbi:MAG: hypothetical protein E7812_12880 [Phenylobacterium sp.]|nr:MAG: hypothetical protein E7812_12880 [Phenylobacterium sp.]